MIEYWFFVIIEILHRFKISIGEEKILPIEKKNGAVKFSYIHLKSLF